LGVVELLVVAVFDGEIAGLARAASISTFRPSVGQVLLERQSVGVLLQQMARLRGVATAAPGGSGALPGGRALLRRVHKGFDLAYVESAGDDLLRQGLDLLVADDGARGAGRELAFAYQRLHAGRQLQEAQGVADVAAALAHHLRELLLRVGMLLDQLVVAGGLLHRVEVGALHVLDQGELEGLGVADVAHDHRHVVDGRALCRAPAAFAGDDLKAAALTVWAHDDRLHQAFGADRIGKLRQLGVGELPARVEAARPQLGDRHHALLAVRRQRSLGLRLRLADERSKAAAEPAALVQGNRHDVSGFSDVIGHSCCSGGP
jgi:hypothetical protein